MAARADDNSKIRTTYTPSTNLTGGVPNATGNPGIGFWRPITALNADADGAVTNDFAAWRPLATTPSHPSSTSGHSATVAAGAEVLRAFFGSDKIVPQNTPVTLTTLPWLIGTNNGTGQLTGDNKVNDQAASVSPRRRIYIQSW